MFSNLAKTKLLIFFCRHDYPDANHPDDDYPDYPDYQDNRRPLFATHTTIEHGYGIGFMVDFRFSKGILCSPRAEQLSNAALRCRSEALRVP